MPAAENQGSLSGESWVKNKETTVLCAVLRRRLTFAGDADKRHVHVVDGHSRCT